MATIEELEQKIRQLENQIHDEEEQNALLMEKAEKAIDTAMNCYKVDHYGYIWAYDAETKKYRKTKMRVMTPEIANEAIESRHLADNAIEGRHLQNDIIEERMIKNKTIDGRSIKDDTIGENQIKPNSVHGDSFKGDAVKHGALADDAVWERNIKDRNVTARKIALEAIFAGHIHAKAVTPEKISDNFKGVVIEPFFDTLDQKYKGITDELYTMIRSLVVGGLALSDRLGSREDIGITQKAITDAINALNARIDDIAGEWTQGFSMVVTPDNFISEDTCQVNISATAQTGVFDHIAFYADDELIVEGDQVATLAYTATIDDTCTIKCVASILGREYIKSKVVTKYYPFFIGGGNTLEEALTPENAREIHGTLAGGYDVTIEEGQHIFVLIPTSLQSQVVRMDMNGYEIPMYVQTGVKNVVYKSMNTYQAGTYNIDITNNQATLSIATEEQIDDILAPYENNE